MSEHDGDQCYAYGITTVDTPLPDGATGVEEGRLRAVDAAGLRGVVSAVDAAAFGQALGERGGDAAWVERTVRAHDAVLRALAAAGPLIPLRFGTIVTGEDELADLLERHREELEETLAHLRGTAEWGIKGHWSTAALHAHVAGSGEPGHRVQPGVATSGGGTAYLVGKSRQQAIADQAAQTMHAVLAECHQRLAMAAREAALLPVTGGAGRDGADGLVLNSSYLVADDGLDAFRSTLAELDAAYGDAGLELELTGPWPPYSFVGATQLSEDLP